MGELQNTRGTSVKSTSISHQQPLLTLFVWFIGRVIITVITGPDSASSKEA